MDQPEKCEICDFPEMFAGFLIKHILCCESKLDSSVFHFFI